MPAKTLRLFLSVMLSWLALAAADAHAHGWSIGVRVGVPGPCYGPRYGPYWPGCYHGYYYPRPVYVMPPPAVYVAPAPIVAPAYPPLSPETPESPSAPTLPPPRKLDDNVSTPSPNPLPLMRGRGQGEGASVATGSIEHYLRDLASPDERVRLESVTQLGRIKSQRAVDPLAATLAGDKSPVVREAAAKALGFIAAPGALPALHRAAQLDADHDVRRTARFAAEIIQAR